MSFGFSVGDFLATAQLAYKLGKALSDAQYATARYEELTAQLHVVHKVLLQVDELRVSKQLAPPTINALMFAVNAASSAMESFLEKNEPYLQASCRSSHGGNMINIFRKTSTGYDPACSVELQLNGSRVQDTPGLLRPGLHVTALITGPARGYEPLGFCAPDNPASFFRPGQIFTVPLLSEYNIQIRRSFFPPNLDNLPLEPIETLKAKAIERCQEGRSKRLRQILRLPLKYMVAYCKQSTLASGETGVACLLCPRRKRRPIRKDEWATCHFRYQHWALYFALVPEEASRELEPEKRAEVDKMRPLAAQRQMPAEFIPDQWIVLGDIKLDYPIESDSEICESFKNQSMLKPLFPSGPVLGRRFVVVYEELDSCLCLGIHTYARQGCKAQPDQDLFAIIHSGNEPPTPLPGETGMRLSPIRMIPHHPSTALPRSARIHFGRIYRVKHTAAVENLGLIDPVSMEDLQDQFEANAGRADNTQVESPETKPLPADMEIVRQIRDSIHSIGGVSGLLNNEC
ncbi:hypothetical protein F5Y10DRAFT_290871 [Nemania abortiva]|nr:hypothetical protein F5Y10DRAFT_290871 [Nemania abortiva]